ncbi:nucleotidyltransferase [Synergistales bacterium]|nr:nucleotidyltransferase [Synergistales bacterium]
MMEKPALVILAAGIGSRYGGLKQIDPVGENGELIIDYSIYDAIKAGFEKVVFIITRAIKDDFMEVIGDRIAKYVKTEYAYQDLNDIPKGYKIPDGRTKPWGTTQALLSTKALINGPFAVINADDFYGASAYRVIYEWLSSPRPVDGKLHFAMVGYRIENTVPEKGSVARGICAADKSGFLTSIVERTLVEKTKMGARFSEDKGETWCDVPAGTLVSMNFWGLDEGFFKTAEDDFPGFLDVNLKSNPLKCEYLLPTEIGDQLKAGVTDVKVLESADTWYGVTYKEDRPGIMAAIEKLHTKGVYPKPLWR